MPLIRKDRLQKDVILGLWKIEENSEYFEGLLDLSTVELDQLGSLKSRRRTEWLASRWLLHVLSDRDRRGALVKDHFGKPHLIGSEWHISLSHTHGYAAVIAAKKSVGIDIQVRVSKITRIAHKFLSEKERTNIARHREIDFLHIYWGIKESLYKAYGRRVLDYKKNLLVKAFNLEQQKTKASISTDVTTSYEARFELLPDFVLTYVIKK